MLNQFKVLSFTDFLALYAANRSRAFLCVGHAIDGFYNLEFDLNGIVYRLADPMGDGSALLVFTEYHLAARYFNSFDNLAIKELEG